MLILNMISDAFKAIGVATVASFIGLFAVLIGVFGIIIFATIGAIMGAITGFIVQYVPILNELVIMGFVQVLNIPNPDLVSIGAMLGFVGGFFKSNNEINKVDLKIPKRPSTFKAQVPPEQPI
jgi:hypothetical protein